MSISSAPDPDDPYDYYMERMRKSGKSERTVDMEEEALNHLQEFLDKIEKQPGQMDEKDALDLVDWLRGHDNIGEHTLKRHANTIKRFYQFYSDRGTYETNPMAVALDRVQFNIQTTQHRRDISVEEMRDFVQTIESPLAFAMVMLLVKTGIRASELCNLDMRDLKIQDPRIEHLLSPRPEIDHREDCIFVSSNIASGQEVNGEKRDNGNKRQRDTILPLDEELKQTLIYWLAVRPTHMPSDANPVFTLQSGYGDIERYARMTRGQLFNVVADLAEAYGWYEVGAGRSQNVTPHYFRHWFTTMTEVQGIDRPLVKYLRGDVGDDVVDRHYRHFWGGEVREEYFKNIYKLLK
ncbi:MULTISPECIES: tyrosine-type recombinase/integrase [Halobacterium]|uniref:tyrosine-type recombinase/integrase n=1 Tax=Halobacterium TaxID=2239 RepID=UPI0018D270C5|nr:MULTISPECIES: tyrosine-type recombinase/integrase [Halobacterium]MCG1004872.1 tyrosine-type recombinase/integrase [Halobacterium noricense]